MRNVLRLSPLLLVYVAAIILIPVSPLWNDEAGYLRFAENLIHGFYADKVDMNLWWGPGYPIVLMPFVALDLPVFALRLLNAFFLFGAAIYFYYTLCNYIDDNYAILFTILFGLYPPSILFAPAIMTESYALFLMCGFIFHVTRGISKDANSLQNIMLAGTYIGLLALTKVIFGYVLLAGLAVFVVVYALNKRPEYKRTCVVLSIALTVCLPYLTYTYSLTGKLFYWGNSGGMSLYWMSTPYNEEYGDWHYIPDVYSNSALLANHHEFLDTLNGLNKVELDERFKAKAIEQITRHPLKFGFNVLCNIGRMFFSYPYSYTSQKPSTFFFMLPNMLVFSSILICVFLIVARKIRIPMEFGILWGICSLYLIGTSFLSAYPRMLILSFPIILSSTIYCIKCCFPSKQSSR